MDDGGQSGILKALREAGSELIDQFYGLSEEELRWRSPEEERSMKETIFHLRDREHLGLRQIRIIAETDGEPLLPTMDIDGLSVELDDQSQDTWEALRAFGKLRNWTVMTLWGLLDQDWERCGRHPYRGLLSIAEIARELAQHDLGHLWQVRRMRHQLSERQGDERISSSDS
jgi:hypothetical protein